LRAILSGLQETLQETWLQDKECRAGAGELALNRAMCHAEIGIHDDDSAFKMTKKQKFPHLVGSKWTAQQSTWGWRHFQVANRKNEGQWVFAELVAACDPDVRFWMNAQQLRQRSLWQAGWKSLAEQRPSELADDAEETQEYQAPA
jgi:tryptophan-rich hypothetical protein